jgi:transcriptional regulator GlxA family with amidase domain
MPADATRHSGPQHLGPQHFVVALTEDFTHLAFACAVEPLRIANLVSGREPYRWSFASADGSTAVTVSPAARRSCVYW